MTSSTKLSVFPSGKRLLVQFHRRGNYFDHCKNSCANYFSAILTIITIVRVGNSNKDIIAVYLIDCCTVAMCINSDWTAVSIVIESSEYCWSSLLPVGSLWDMEEHAAMTVLCTGLRIIPTRIGSRFWAFSMEYINHWIEN